MPAQGLTTIRSNFGPKDTMDRLETAVKAKGMAVFARFDHAAGAAAAGLPLRPTEVLVFGNARGGTPLMQSVQTIGIDLPVAQRLFPFLPVAHLVGCGGDLRCCREEVPCHVLSYGS